MALFYQHSPPPFAPPLASAQETKNCVILKRNPAMGFSESRVPNWMVYKHLVGGLVAINFIFPLILGMSSSQLTKSYFSEEFKPLTSHICRWILDFAWWNLLASSRHVRRRHRLRRPRLRWRCRRRSSGPLWPQWRLARGECGIPCGKPPWIWASLIVVLTIQLI